APRKLHPSHLALSNHSTTPSAATSSARTGLDLCDERARSMFSSVGMDGKIPMQKLLFPTISLIVLLASAVSAASSGGAPAATPSTGLQALVQQILERNPEIQAARGTVKAARARIP